VGENDGVEGDICSLANVDPSRISRIEVRAQRYADVAADVHLDNPAKIPKTANDHTLSQAQDDFAEQ
jgi:hypothetical protein